MTRIDPIAAVGFGSAADVYERARPSYPVEAIDWIAERCGFGPGVLVVDVGAGTGKLTRLLVGRGARVVGVEPVAEMRSKLVETTPAAEAVDGTAESLGFETGSVDVITVGTAFHWFDHAVALAELHRVLRPGGHLVLVGNMRDLDDALQASVEALLAPLRGRLAARQGGGWRDPLAASPLFGPIERREFRFVQELTVEGVCERVSSTSFVAALEPAERDRLLERVRAVTKGPAEPFPFRYRTEVLVIPRSSDPAGEAGGTSIKG